MFSDLYVANVDQFCMGVLGIESPYLTKPPSETHSPRTPILLEREMLGEGNFSVVTRVWDVSTGFEYASKKFRFLDDYDWKREASLLKKISHVSRKIRSFRKLSADI